MSVLPVVGPLSVPCVELVPPIVADMPPPLSVVVGVPVWPPLPLLLSLVPGSVAMVAETVEPVAAPVSSGRVSSPQAVRARDSAK